MAGLGIKDVKEMNDIVKESSKKGFGPFVLTMIQYGLFFLLGYMIFNFQETLKMLNDNVSTYVLLVVLATCVLYFTNKEATRTERKKTLDLYIEGQKNSADEMKKTHDELIKRRMKVSPKINDVLKDMLISLDADRVAVCEMHNGTNNLSGLPFLFADMAYEVDAHGVEDISDEYKNTNLSRYPIIGKHYEEGIYLSTVDGIEEEDPRFAMKLRIGKTAYFAGIVIRGINNPLGFLTVTYGENSVVPKKEHIIQELTKGAQIISSLLDSGTITT